MLPRAWGRVEQLLFRRLFLGRRLLPSLAIPFTIGMVFTATYWVSNGFALSGEQLAQRELGRFEHAVALDVEPGDLGRSSVHDVTRALRAKGLGRSSISIISSDIRPDQLGVSPTAGPQRVLSFLEAASPQTDFPARFHLTSGRWPLAAGEVVLTYALHDRLKATSFTAFGGLASFRVVGTFDDRFATDSTGMLAAPGTWESIPIAASKAFAPQGSLRVMWTGREAASTVDSLVRATLALAPPPGGNRPATDRAELVRARDQSLSDRQRLLFAYPLFLLSAMAGASVFRSNRRWVRAYHRRCRDVGLSPWGIGAVLGGVLASGALCAALVGIAAGAMVGLALRAWALPHVLTQPLGPMRPLSPVITAALVLTGVTLLAQLIDIAVSGHHRRLLAKTIDVVPWALARRVTAALALLHGIQMSARPTVRFDDLGGTGVLVSVAAVLLAPDLLSIAQVGLSRRRPRTMVARRMIDADRGALALVAMIVAATVAFPVITNSFNASARRSNDAGFASMVRPHQLWVDGSDPRSDAAPLASAISKAVHASSPIELRSTDAFVYPTGGRPVENTSIVTVPRAHDLVGLLGDKPWVHEMDEYVARGGVAFLDGPVRRIHTRDPKVSSVQLPTRTFGETSTESLAPFAAVMLADTATKAHLTGVPLATVFTRLSPRQTDASIAAVRQAGLDIRLLRFYTPPLKTRPTPESYFAMGALLVLASFMLASLMRAIGERMRERAGQLLAVGFRRRWSGSVAALQLGVAVIAGLVMGAGGAAVAVWVFATSPKQSMLLNIPLGFVATTVGLVIVTSLVGIATCVARVHAQAQADI